MRPILSVEDLSKSFGSLSVIEGFDMDPEDGEALGIIGPNGAGKSTLFNRITGSLPPDGGRIVFAGQDITSMPAHLRCRTGLGRSYQIPHPFAGMTVFENLLVGAVFGGDGPESRACEGCADILERVGLIGKANVPAGALTEHEIRQLVETIGGIRAQAISIIWVEHIVHALLSVIDRLVVINFGCKMDDGDPRTVIESPAVREICMGVAVE